MKYYLLRVDMSHAEKWLLGDIKHCDNWHFINPPVEFMEPCTYELDVVSDGLEIDYSTAGYASVPVISGKARQALIGLAEIDEPYFHVVLEPITLGNKQVVNDYFVMIIETQIDCVDEEQSEFQKYELDDPVRPDRAGEYRSFFNLVVDPSKIGDHHVFRIKKHLGAIVVSEEFKRRFEEAGVTGVVYESVNGDVKTVA